ncbi:hypothetical protein J6590_081659 [Homalodisca vitripennis]|nr:hypothetical protein J6590_081659 [Homalodisca vitripennis]
MHLPGSPDDVTSLQISATAEVFAESKCQHVLRLSNLLVEGPDYEEYDGLNADCSKPIRFSYSDGKLDELCAKADDEGVSLNIKRAVISLLSSVKNQDGGSGSASENDIFGICPTEFTISSEGSKVKIQKFKNLNRCALREEFNFPFPTTPYQAVQSSFGSFETSPLLGSELKVSQDIENGVLQRAEGTETYNYRPLMNPEAGATVKVFYTLTLESSRRGAITAKFNSPKGVFYEAVHDSDGIKNQGTISAALRKAVNAIDPVATPEAAREFANLVHVIEQGNKVNILAAYSAAQGETAKNLFLDGLLYAGSAESVEAAAELLSSKRIPEESALLWYLDLNFVKHVSRGSLTSLMPLLSGDKVPYQAYLGIGSVAGKFCLQHPQLCETSQEYKQLLARLAAPLAGGCKVDSHEKENNIIASLKGLRNTRHLTAEIAQQISQCAADRSARSRVRVAALEAFHADASKPVQEDFISLFSIIGLWVKTSNTSVDRDLFHSSNLAALLPIAPGSRFRPSTTNTTLGAHGGIVQSRTEVDVILTDFDKDKREAIVSLPRKMVVKYTAGNDCQYQKRKQYRVELRAKGLHMLTPRKTSIQMNAQETY